MTRTPAIYAVVIMAGLLICIMTRFRCIGKLTNITPHSLKLSIVAGMGLVPLTSATTLPAATLKGRVRAIYQPLLLLGVC